MDAVIMPFKQTNKVINKKLCYYQCYQAFYASDKISVVSIQNKHDKHNRQYVNQFIRLLMNINRTGQTLKFKTISMSNDFNLQLHCT